jgi:hypothetical protein
MLSVISPTSEVVKEGRILNKIKHLQTRFAGVFYFTPGFGQRILLLKLRITKIVQIILIV